VLGGGGDVAADGVAVAGVFFAGQPPGDVLPDLPGSQVAFGLIREPLFPGVLVLGRTIGMFRMRDEAGGDDKLICVPAHDPRQEHLRDLHHLPEFHRLEIQHFFEIYKELEPGKSVEGASWAARTAAEAELEASRRRLKEADG
jgi:inorganic pyrophosphatase